jgi:hypothetical protein
MSEQLLTPDGDPTANFIDNILEAFIRYMEEVLVLDQTYGLQAAEETKRYLLMLSVTPKFVIYNVLQYALTPFKDDHNGYLDKLAEKLHIDPKEIKPEHRHKITRFVQAFIELLIKP